MTRLRLALVGLALTTLAACGTRRDPDFCCTSGLSCAASGAVVDVTPCTDPAAPVCDDDGDVGAPRTCIADTGGACAAPGDCLDPARPFCIGNRCVECQDADATDACANPTPACSPTTHLCVPCTDAPGCAGDPGGAVCLDGSCVECADAGDCPSADRGVCDDASHTCRGCVADGECASAVCRQDTRTCAPAAEVLYVEVGATGTACTQAAPCGTVEEALALAGAGPRTIKLGPGLHRGTVSVAGARTIAVHGAGIGATTLRYFSAVPDAPFITVSGGATLTLEGLLINGAPPTTPAIRCTGATLDAFRVHVDSVPQGGIDLNACSFALVNTMVTRCGSASSLFGGVSLTNLTGAHAVRFEFNTIVGNSAAGNNVAGVACAILSTPVALTSSIIFGNDRADSVPVGDDSDCAVTYSVIDVTPAAATNTDVDPGLTAPGFHLGAGASAIGRADPAATVGYDIDGDARAGARDCGADELP